MNVNSFLGSAELALGRDDQGRGCKHDDNAEDQESRLVRRRHDVVGGWLIAPSKLAWKIATNSTLLAVTL
jgi:hypothetical protein